MLECVGCTRITQAMASSPALTAEVLLRLSICDSGAVNQIQNTHHDRGPSCRFCPTAFVPLIQFFRTIRMKAGPRKVTLSTGHDLQASGAIQRVSHLSLSEVANRRRTRCADV